MTKDNRRPPKKSDVVPERADTSFRSPLAADMSASNLKLIWSASDNTEPEPAGSGSMIVDHEPDIQQAWERYVMTPHQHQVQNALATILYRKYHLRLLGLARRRLRDPSLAVEVVQAVYYCLIGYLRNAGGSRFFNHTLLGWLQQTTCFTVNNFNRSRARRQARIDKFTHHCRVLLEHACLRKQLERELDSRQREAKIVQFLDQLDDQSREIVLLRSRGLPLRNIAKSMNISESTVGRRLRDVRNRFRIRARRDPLLAELLDEIGEDDGDR